MSDRNIPTETVSEEQRELINKLAGSISGLCHTVIARRLGQFFEVIGDELQKEREIPEDIAQLMRFYNVKDMEALVRIQSSHVERLQAKLPPLRDERPGYVPREG